MKHVGVIDIANSEENTDWIKIANREAQQREIRIRNELARKELEKAISESQPWVVLTGAKGGPGSGHHGHAGRPGQIGGSASGGGISANIRALEKSRGRAVKHSVQSPEKFRAALDKNLNPKFSAFVTRYTAQEYREMKARTFVSETGKSGFAIKPDGDIISVFSESSSGEGFWALVSAIQNGGIKLDCFDGFLPAFYKKFGFDTYDTWTWDDQFAPGGWDYDKFDRPSVILMRLPLQG